MPRTDIHAPASFDPADYEVIDYLDVKRPEPPHPASGAYGNEELMRLYNAMVADWQARIFEHFPDWRTGGTDHHSIYQCNHCGHQHLRWVAVVEHRPSGAKLAFGEICAERCELPGRSAFKAKFIHDRAAREAAELARQTARAEFEAAHPEVSAFLRNDERFDNNEFLLSLAAQLRKDGTLTDRQVEAAERVIARDAQRAERRATEQAQLANAPALPEGRYEIRGTAISAKVQPGDYGDTTKWLVKLADGNKVWGTIPGNILRAIGSDGVAALIHHTKTYEVSFTAQVERSRDDDHFGFYKRPTGATIA